jgi:glyoxylase I family protein
MIAIEHRAIKSYVLLKSRRKSDMDSQVKIAEIDHVVFRCRDQKTMLDFYTRLMGLTEERRLEQMGLIQLRAGRSMIDLVPAEGKPDAKSKDVDHVCLGIEATDMSAVAQYLKEASVDIIEGPVNRYGAHGMGLSIYIHDPEGNVIELKQMPK